jgi:hypothetical protein
VGQRPRGARARDTPHVVSRRRDLPSVAAHLVLRHGEPGAAAVLRADVSRDRQPDARAEPRVPGRHRAHGLGGASGRPALDRGSPRRRRRRVDVPHEPDVAVGVRLRRAALRAARVPAVPRLRGGDAGARRPGAVDRRGADRAPVRVRSALRRAGGARADGRDRGVEAPWSGHACGRRRVAAEPRDRRAAAPSHLRRVSRRRAAESEAGAAEHLARSARAARRPGDPAAVAHRDRPPSR